MQPENGPTPAIVIQPAPVRQYAPVRMMMQARRSRVFQVVPSAPPKPTTSMGYDVVKTFTIHESERVNGFAQYELLVDGESVWAGWGNDRAEALLEAIIRATDEGEPESLNG